MIKVNVISGFLGAGKTTLFRKLLKDVFAGQNVVLVENEYGEVGVDAGFLQGSNIVVREVNGGCICCSLRGDFREALENVVHTYHPQRILIEPSGVGKLSDILAIIRSVPELEIDSYSTVVDAKRCQTYHKNFGAFFDDQIQHASCIILTRTEAVGEETLRKDVDIIRALNLEAHVITTPLDELSGQAVFDAMTDTGFRFPTEDEEHEHENEHHHDHAHEHEHHHEHEHEHEHEHHHDIEAKANEGLAEGNRIHIGSDDHEHHHHEHHHGPDADDVFDSIGIETINVYSLEQIQEALAQLPETVVRAKGIVPSPENDWLFFDYVSGDIDIRKGSPAYTGLITVIGEHVDVELIKRIFGVH